jgi:tetratricopeptide (TPR) repeat protein
MGDALRVVMELTHVPTERVVLVEKVDGKLSDIFAIQDRLAEKAAAALELRERAADAAKATAPASAPALDAYASYTKGRQHWIKMTKGEFDRAQELYEQAVAQDPNYADALAGLAAVHGLRFTFTTDPHELERAIAHARRAIAVTPDHSEAHVWLAYALWRSRDLDGALKTIERATELGEVNHYPAYFKACMLLNKGEPEPALPLYQKAVGLFAAFGFAWVGLANTHLRLGRYDEAEWSFDRAIELETKGFHSTSGAGAWLGECLRQQGRLDEARRACLDALDAIERSDHMYRDTFRGICLDVLGRVALEQDDPEGARTAYHQAVLHLGGRPRTLGGGHLLCQAFAGRAAADRDAAALREARALYETRTKGDWSWLWHCEEFVTLETLRFAEARISR